MRRRDLGAMLAAFVVAWPAIAVAQNYPTRPITMVVPYAAGGSFDVIGRLVGARMSATLGQPIIIENTTGGGGIIGTKRVANAVPDGYVFLLGSIGTHAYNQTIYRKRRYDAVADFAPVALFAEQPMVLLTRKDFPAGNLQEFIAYVKSNSDKVKFGSAGVGSSTHLGCAVLNARIGVATTHVPYRGGGPAAQDLTAGQIDYVCLNIGGAAPLVAGGLVKAIAVLSRARAPLVPTLRTAEEQGLSDLDVNTWNAFFLPKGTPEAIVRRLNEACSEAIDNPAVQARFHDLGITAVAPARRSPDYLAKFVVEEIEKWAAPIKASRLQVD
jgi:tripartite-type tricarboxylate transporter receptor subunit TctC